MNSQETGAKLDWCNLIRAIILNYIVIFAFVIYDLVAIVFVNYSIFFDLCPMSNIQRV